MYALSGGSTTREPLVTGEEQKSFLLNSSSREISPQAMVFGSPISISSSYTKLWFKKIIYIYLFWDFSGGSDGKEFTCNAGGARDVGLIPGSGRSPREANHNPFQYSCLGSPMGRGAWWAPVHEVRARESLLTGEKQKSFLLNSSSRENFPQDNGIWFSNFHIFLY